MPGHAGHRRPACSSRSSPAAGPSHHRDGDGPVERHHRVRRRAARAARRARGSAASRCLGARPPRRARRRSRPGAGTGRAAPGPARRVTSATPSCDRTPVPPARGPARRAGPARRRARCAPARRASVSSISASSPATSPSSGSSRADRAGEPDRLGGQLGALQVGAGGRGVALVEDQVEHVQDDAQPLGPLRLRRHAGTATPLVLMRCLARLIRWAIVASGTRKARAISAVVRPPTARRVSASWRRRATAPGWQHRNSRVSVSSSLRRGSSSGRRRDELVGGTCAAVGVLAAAPRLVAAQLVGQPAGRDRDQPAPRVVGHALGRPLDGGGEQRLLHRVLARRRSGRSGGRARRGPAAPARAAGPRLPVRVALTSPRRPRP